MGQQTKSVSVKHQESPFERFQRFVRGLVAVPKMEVEAEEMRWRADRQLKKKPADG